MSSIAIIPARGGSKRIPHKNVRDFCGKPIIAYSIESALSSEYIDEVMVSTDDAEIAEFAVSAGAKVPFLRSAETANDTATIAESLLEVLSRYRERSMEFEHVCCILATAPFVTPDTLKNAFGIYQSESFDSLVPVVRFDYPVLRALKREGEQLSMMWPEYVNTRSQDLPVAYHDAGIFYWIRTERLAISKKIFMERTGSIVIDSSMAQDIDTEEDWTAAEFKYRYIREKRYR